MICIYAKNETVFTYNGLAVLEPTECFFKPSINGVWSLEMTVPYDLDKKYDYIDNDRLLKVTDIDCIAEQTSGYQLFRIYDFKKQDDAVYVIAYPVGLDARFDTYTDDIRMFNKTAAEALTQLNNMSNKYTVSGSGYSSDTASIEYQKANLIQIINGSDSDVNNTTYKSFVNTYDGEICYDNYNIKINHRLGSNLTPIDVRYGKNITGMSYDLDNSNVITRLYPYAKSGEAYNGIDEYKMENNRYRDAPNASDYPIPHIYYVETPDTLIQTSNDGSMTYQRTMAFFNDIKATVGNWLRDALLDEATGDEILEVVELDWINQMYALTTDKDNVEGIVEHMWKKVVNDTTYPLKSATFKNLIYSAMKAGFDNVLKSDGTLYIGTSSKKWFSGEEIDHDFYSYTWDVYGRYRANKRGLAEYLWVYANSKWRQVDVYGYGTGATDDSKWKWYKNKKTDTYKHYGNKKKKRYLHDEWWKINDVWYEFDGDGKSIKGSALYNYNIDLFDNAKVFDSRRGNVTLYDYLIPYCKEQEEYFFHQLYLSMYAYCNGMFEEQGLSYPIPKIEINIVDLSQTIEYSSYQNLEKIKLGNTVNVTNPKIGVNPKELRVTGLTYDVLRKCNTEIQIGVTESTVINLLDSIGKNGSGDRIISSSSTTEVSSTGVQDVILDGETCVYGGVAYIDLNLEDIGLQWFEETENALYGINEGMSFIHDPRFLNITTVTMREKWNSIHEYYPSYVTINMTASQAEIVHTAFMPKEGNTMQSDYYLDVATIHTVHNAGQLLFISKDAGALNFPVVFTNGSNGWSYDGRVEYSSSNDTAIENQVKRWDSEQQRYFYQNVVSQSGQAVIDGETWYGLAVYREMTDYDYCRNALSTKVYLPKEDLPCFRPSEYPRGNYPTFSSFLADFIPRSIDDYESEGKYSGLARKNNLAFFAGGTDEFGTGAPIKIFADGTYEGLDKVEDVQLEGVSLVDENKIAHVDDAVKVKDVKYGSTSLVTDKIAQLDSLQEKLTEGDNVQINNNVISATDTTYSAFEGATSSADGESGLVPKPLIADKDKFLKGDGTWASAGGGGGGNVDDVNVNGVSVVDSNRVAQIKSYKEVTQSEYDALPQSKLTDGVLYCIKDAGGGGGASSLEELDDVNISTPINGQVLSYDSTNDKWINTTPSGGGGSWNYSITKVDTGQKWIDGRTIYCKVYTWQTQITNIGNNSWKNLDIPSNDENWDIFINVIGGNQVGVVWNFLSLNYDGANYLQIWNPRSAAIQLKWLAVWFVETTTS